MRTLRHLIGSTLAAAALTGLSLAAQAQTPYVFQTSGNTYTEDFSTISTWASLTTGATATAFTGTGAGATPASRFGRVATTASTGITTASPTSITNNIVFTTNSTGAIKVTAVTTGITQPALGFSSSSTGNSTAVDQFLDFTNRNAGNLSFNWAEVNNSTGGRGGTLQVYTSTDGATFTQLGTDITVYNNVASNGSFSQALPASFNGSSSARIRYYYHSIATPANLGTNSGSRPFLAIDDVVITATAAGGSPSFSAAASAATTVTTKSVASAGAGVSFSGANLTSGVTATTSAPFGLSLTSGGPYTTSVVIPQNLSGGLFVNINSATAGDFTGSITYSGGGVGSITPTNLTGKVLATQPASQPTITASNPTFSTIDLTVTGGSSQKYLIVGKTGSAAAYVATQVPTDAVTYTASTTFGSGDGVGTAANYALSAGTTTSITVTNLSANTQYSFAVFAYNDDNTAAVENYLTTGFPTSAPSNANTAEATTLSPPPNIYLWVGPANGSYTTAANWISQAGSAIGAGQQRTTPAVGDVLTFGSGTSTVLVDLTANEQIGGLLLASSANVTLTLNGATDRTITVVGTATGDDFDIPASSTLNIRNNANGGGLKLTLNTPTTGTIAGTLDMNGATPALLSDPVLTVSGSANAVEVLLGGAVTVGANATGSVIAGATALVFRNGSTLTQSGGSTPAASFEPTSTMVWNQNSQIGLSNRTYGNLTLLNHSNATSTGGGTLTINNLTFSATGKTLSMAVTGGMTINGNISVTAGTLNFTPASGSLTLSSPTATVTSVSPITLSGLTLNKANGATLELEDVVIGTAAITLGTGTDLNISKKLTFTTSAGITTGANTLKLLSDATQTAYVVANPATASGTAAATVQRAIDGTLGINGVGYRHYAAPVSGATVDQLGGVLNTAYNTSPTPLTVMPYPTVFAYDPTRVNANNNNGFKLGYISPATGDPMTVGKGFSVRKGTSTVELSGTLVTGNQTLTLVGDGTGGNFFGWNLLGNPYPSALDWNATTIPSGVGAVAYAVVPTGPTSGIYQQYDHTALATNRELPMAQGFFLRKTNNAPSASVALTNAMRVTTGDGNPMNRAAQPTTAALAGLHLTIARPGMTIKPEAAIYFTTGASAGLDDMDGITPGRSFGDMPTLLTVIGGSEAGVNCLPAFSGAQDVVVPVLVATPVSGQYKIDVSLMANFPAGTQVLLEDALTGRTQDLALNPSYSFQSDADYAGQRFTVRFTTASRVLGTSADLTASALSVYPNPAAGSVRVSAAAGTTVRVFDALGRVVRTTRIDAAGTEVAIALDGLKAGLYTVRAGAASQKLVIE